MKIGVSYSVFEGEELLEASIASIRKSVDYINVVYQTTSYKKTKCSENLEYVLYDLKKRKLIDDVIFYETDFSFLNIRQNEVNKRNIGLDYARKNGCDYFLPIDSDEFYFPDQFENAKRYILKNKIKNTFCTHKYYIKESFYRSINVAEHMIQFISKIDKNSRYSFAQNKEFYTDPTRILVESNRSNSYIFSENQLVMQHMSFVRKSLKNKYDSNFDPTYYKKTIKSIEEWEFPNDFILPVENKSYKIEKLEIFFNIDVNRDLKLDKSKTLEEIRSNFIIIKKRKLSTLRYILMKFIVFFINLLRKNSFLWKFAKNIKRFCPRITSS